MLLLLLLLLVVVVVVVVGCMYLEHSEHGQVKHICASWAAFVALREDGTLVAWGAEFFGAALPESW